MPKSSKKAPTKTKTLPYDVAEELRTPEEMAAYLDAWLAEAPDDVACSRPPATSWCALTTWPGLLVR